MIDYVVRFVGCVNLIVFFAADFFFAYVLHVLKQDHPAIDECAPAAADVDTVAILSDLHRFQQSTAPEDGEENIGVLNYAVANTRQTIIHRCVIVASFCAPIFSFLQIIAPVSMSWSMFSVPNWLGYMSMIPGLGISMFYASRAMRVSNFSDVSKTQWLSMMWFRLDMMCVMATVLLLGWGDWLVAMCIFAVALYLAHRLLVTERKLAAEIKHSQLIREEINLDSLKSNAPPASPEKRYGYDSVRKV